MIVLVIHYQLRLLEAASPSLQAKRFALDIVVVLDMQGAVLHHYWRFLSARFLVLSHEENVAHTGCEAQELYAGHEEDPEPHGGHSYREVHAEGSIREAAGVQNVPAGHQVPPEIAADCSEQSVVPTDLGRLSVRAAPSVQMDLAGLGACRDVHTHHVTHAGEVEVQEDHRRKVVGG